VLIGVGINMSKTTTLYGGPGYLGLLSLIFVVAKLTGYIDWSWWIVLLPMLIIPVIIIIIVVIIGIKCWWEDRWLRR